MKKKEETALLLGREPTVSELSEILGTDVAETAMLLNASMPAVSLTSGEEGENQLDIPVESPENEISDFLGLRQVIFSLEEQDKSIIELRYYKGLTQQKTADLLGMTQVQVSRREKTILGLIRKKLSQ